MNEIAVIDIDAIRDAIVKAESLKELFEAPTTQGNAGLKKEASLNLARISKLLDSKRAEAVKPALTEQRRINELFKPAIEKLETMSKGFITQVAAFAKLEERKAQEARALQAKIDAEALLANKPITPRAEVAAPVVAVSETKVWTYEVVPSEYEKIPRAYLLPNDQAIRDAIKAGTRHIPGLKIYEKTIIGRR